MSDSGSNIVIASDPTFELDVYGRSTLVLIDFWAAWCAPCRMLTPILEKVAVENESWLTLVKVNTDECPVAAGGFGIQGIPAVFAMLGDEVVDQFQGAMPETAIRQWLANLKPKWDLHQLIANGTGDTQSTIAKLRELIAVAPNDVALQIRLAELLLDVGDTAGVSEIIATLEGRGFLEPEAAKLKARLSLSQKSGLGSIEQLTASVERNPADFDSTLKLAQALAGAEQYAAACEQCLKLVSLDRKATGEQARELMVEIFRVLPDESEITANYRRQLALALY